MRALIEIENVSKCFGFREILNEINFSVDRGEFILIIGNNGVGKSTLLNIISSIMRPSKGKINFRGEKQKDNLLEWLKIIGTITHVSRLYEDLDSRDNLKFYGCLLYTSDAADE